MSAFDTLVQGDWRIIVCDRVIRQTTPQFSKHVLTAQSNASLQSNTRTKCSVFKIRKEQLTCWHIENEFWGQKHVYDTDYLKDNLQLESKPSGFIWLSRIHISFSQQLLVESISSVVWQIVSTSGKKLKAKGKKISFNKPS